MLYLAVCMWLKICLYLAKWLLRDNVKFKTCKETWVFFFFPFPPAHSLLVCSLLPVRALYSSQGWIHHSQPCLTATGQGLSSALLRKARPAPLTEHHPCSQQLQPPQLWPLQEASAGLVATAKAEQTQARISHGAHLGVLGLFTSDQTNTKPRVMVATATSQSPGSRALWAQEPFQLQAVTLSLLTRAAASWQWHTADFAWFCFCCAKNA